MIRQLKAILILIFLFDSSSTKAQWRQKQIREGLSNCQASFPNAQTGYVLSSPNLQVTNDSGKSWQWIPTPQGHNLFDVFFINDSVGWIAGGNHPNGIMYRTNNRGKNWVMNSTPLKQILKVFFINDKLGWAVGNENLHSLIYHTTDGGSEWSIQYEGTDYLRTIHFSSAENGWAAGDNGQLFYTQNAGQQWTPSPRIDIIHYRCCLSISAETAWAGGGYQNGGIYQTKDGGKKWNAIENNTLAHINYISIINKKEIWLAGDRGTIMYSPNGGNTWLPQSITSKEDIQYIKFFSSGYGVAVGAKGTVFYYP